MCLQYSKHVCAHLALLHLHDAISMFAYSSLLDDMYYMS